MQPQAGGVSPDGNIFEHLLSLPDQEVGQVLKFLDLFTKGHLAQTCKAANEARQRDEEKIFCEKNIIDLIRFYDEINILPSGFFQAKFFPRLNDCYIKEAIASLKAELLECVTIASLKKAVLEHVETVSASGFKVINKKTFSNRNLNGVVFPIGKLAFIDCTFDNCDLRAARFRGPDEGHERFYFINCTMTNCDLSGSQLTKVVLHNCTFTTVIFVLAKFNQVDIVTPLIWSGGVKSSKHGAQFIGCNFTGLILEGCNICCAIFEDVSWTDVQFLGGRILGSAFKGNKTILAIKSISSYKCRVLHIQACTFSNNIQVCALPWIGVKELQTLQLAYDYGCSSHSKDKKSLIEGSEEHQKQALYLEFRQKVCTYLATRSPTIELSYADLNSVDKKYRQALLVNILGIDNTQIEACIRQREGLCFHRPERHQVRPAAQAFSFRNTVALASLFKCVLQ